MSNKVAKGMAWRKRSLNPYSNGIYSMSQLQIAKKSLETKVLILILMEYTL